MKAGIHPKEVKTTVICSCGTTFDTISIKPKLEVDICSGCHPVFTGQQKFVDRAGRIERFKDRYANALKNAKEPAKKAKK